MKIEQLCDEAASEAMLIDLDGDGEEELFTMLPFHGDTIRIYKKCGNAYAAVYEYPEKLEFLHAISGGNISGEPTVVVGHRKGERRLLAFRSDKKGGYTAECLDEHTGAANLLHYTDGSKEMLLATNREIGVSPTTTSVIPGWIVSIKINVPIIVTTPVNNWVNPIRSPSAN